MTSGKIVRKAYGPHPPTVVAAYDHTCILCECDETHRIHTNRDGSVKERRVLAVV
jgi:hypothetical protein